jgi:hypothetical protein
VSFSEAHQHLIFLRPIKWAIFFKKKTDGMTASRSSEIDPENLVD